MNYCVDCLLPTNLVWCPHCGNKELRPVTLNDWCLLTQQEAMWAPALKDYLNDNGIFFVTQGTGRGLSAYGVFSHNAEIFYVRAVDYDRARELTDAFLNAETFLAEDGSEWRTGGEVIVEPADKPE